MGAAINAIIGGFGVKISRTPVPVIAWTNAPNQASSYAVAPNWPVTSSRAAAKYAT
jgi:hypothetical protein